MPAYLTTKDPDAVLDYVWDWSAWLADTDDTIATAAVTSDDLTVVSSGITDNGTTVTAWLSGGTVGATASICCRITTTGGRTDDRTMKLKIAQR